MKKSLNSLTRFVIILLVFNCCKHENREIHEPMLRVSENGRYLESQKGEPYLWLGGTIWGMSEWLSRESINFYLDDRKGKGFNLVGGDVPADAGGNFPHHYWSMAEGIILGITGEMVKWNEKSPLWDFALMTYHPDGKPSRNFSEWFHDAVLIIEVLE